jgi:hypothetical protein
MPRNVRNFWVELDVDGRSRVATGPRSKDGGFELNIKMRDEGSVKEAVRIVGNALEDGSLELHILPFDGEDIVIETENVGVKPFVQTRR